MEEFLKEHGGKCAIIVKDSHKDIPLLFPSIKRVITFKRLPPFQFLVAFAKFEPGHFAVGHPYFGNDLLEDTPSYSTFKPFLTYLHINPNTIPAKPVISKQSKRKAIELMEALGLPSGKTVVLIPYVASVKPLNGEWWYKIRDKLIEKGFTVITNVGPHEKPIPGTIGLSVPFNEIIPIAEYAGWVIGIRTGLFDILSSANCKLTILYPKMKWRTSIVSNDNVTAINVLSLKYARKDDLSEFEVDEFPDQALLNKVVQI